MTNDEILHASRAWRWVWPDERNRWATANNRRKGPPEPYHGAGKKAIARRNRKKNQ